jgi:hypothetical protein
VQQEREHGSDGPKVGICCSGGGIRAASFALGALQVLQEKGQLHGEQKAAHLSAVSGGSYIVGAMASVQKSIEAGSSNTNEPTPPFAPGSPEELRLRTRLGYLTRGPGGVPNALWRLVLGIVINLSLLGSIVLIAGVALGWLYGWRLPELRWYAGNPSGSTHIEPRIELLIVLFALVGIAFAVGIASMFAIRPRHRRTRQWMARISWVALLAAVAWAVFTLGLPQLLAWLHRITVASDNPGNEAGQNFFAFTLAGIAGVFASVAGVVAPMVRWVRTGLVDVRQPQSRTRKFLHGVRKWALNLLMLVSIPLLLVGAFVWFAKQAAADPPIPGSGAGAIALWAGLAGGAIVFLWLAYRLADLNRWSLHAIYEDRLADAFGVERCPPDDPRGTVAGDEAARTRPEPLRLSQSQPADFPEVLICATANVFEYGIAPTARGAAPFLFSAEMVGDDGQISGASETAWYEQWGFYKPEDLSLTTAISISGAAVAPQMGKQTRRPLRFLLALANIRLGVWLSKPNRLSKFERRGRKRGAQTPGPSYLLLHEMLGVDRGKDPFVYVTDGGHYDNLGLVELFRRKCDLIWCIDASGDHIDTFSTLGGALAMAEADLGVTVDIHPVRDMAPESGSRYVRKPFCIGSVTYPDSSRARVEKKGKLVVVKAGVPENAPWSVRSYHAENEDFPCDPTLDQLYTASRCDAYAQLGRFAMSEAWGAHQQAPAP